MMPLIPGVLETFEKLGRLHKTKNDDYAGDKGAFFNFEFADYVSSFFIKARDKVYATMMGIKLARLAVVLTSDKVNHESVEDTFDDMILYATIWKSDYMARVKGYHPKVEVATIRETNKA
jgi:hypothetical protein